MKMISPAAALLLAIAACGASAARADDPLGFYVGGGVGESTIRSDDPAYGYPAYFDDHQTAWKAIIGIHPDLLPVGAELEYIDFGQPDHHRDYDVDEYGLDSHPHGPVLFAVGYLPIPIPYVDFFGKLGVARLTLTESTLAADTCAQGPGCPPYIVTSRQNVTDTRVAYGAGVESKLPWGFSVRAEYERISSSHGDPDAFTVSAVWRF